MAKPYSIVRFIECTPYRINQQEPKVSGCITFKLKVLTPLHVGAGLQFIDERNIIYKSFYRWNDQLAIPGSTLKGCVRNIAESVSHSCLSGRIKEKSREYQPIVNKNEEKNKGKCIICDMFGCMGEKSKISVGQLLMEKGTSYSELLPDFKGPHITESMLENGRVIGYRFYHHGKANIIQKGEVPYEVVKPGSVFKGKIQYRNLTREQLALLSYALGFSGDIALKMGYGKPAYLGSVQLEADDDQYKQLAQVYRNTKDQEIQRAIGELESILNYTHAKVKSEWNEDGTY